MGGRFQTNLNANVTHLVCGVCASSEKYFVNWSMAAPICNHKSPSIHLGSGRKWNSGDDARLGTKRIDSLWTEVNRRAHVDLPMILLFRTVKATDPTFERFKCPLFYKFTITLSGFSERDRTTIKQYVEREGATYSPNLIKDQCTHLICKEPRGNGRESKRSELIFSVQDRSMNMRSSGEFQRWNRNGSSKVVKKARASAWQITFGLLLISNRLIRKVGFPLCSNSYLLSYLILENEIPIIKDMVDSASKTTPSFTEQRRKSTTHLTNEEMNDLDERFNQWLTDRSKQLADDLFDGLKVVHPMWTNRYLRSLLPLGVFGTIFFQLTDAYAKDPRPRMRRSVGELSTTGSSSLLPIGHSRFDALNPSVTHIIRGSEPPSAYAQLSALAPK